MTKETIARQFDAVPRAGVGGLIVEGLRRYTVNRTRTGGFLQAVLENDLRGAVRTADAANYQALADIVRFCSAALPAIAWGSPAAVRSWLEGSDISDIASER